MSDHLTVTTSSGRALRVHSAGDPAGPTVFVLHGSPSSGMLYPPNVHDAAAHGLRLVSYDRPGYGGSTPHPGRRVADAAAHVGAIADQLGGGRFAGWGHSGGGPHARGCAARGGGCPAGRAGAARPPPPPGRGPGRGGGRG